MSGEASQGFEVDPAARLLKERQSTPWYETVKASEILYAIEHPRIVQKSTALGEKARQQILATENSEEQATLLLKDLTDPVHAIALGAFNGPQFTEEFITGIEAGKLLVLLADRHPDLKQMIADHLSTLVKAANTPDPTRGAAVYFLGKIDPEEMSVVKDELGAGRSKAAHAGYVTYLDYYLQKSAVKGE